MEQPQHHQGHSASDAGLGIRALSPSRAADFRSCPLKFRYRTIDRLPEPPSLAASRGTLVHAALERLYRRTAAERTEQVAAEPLTDIWADMVADRPALGDLIDDDTLPDWFEQARRLIHTYFGMENPRGFDPESCEMRLEVTLPTGVPTRGFVDRVDVSPDGLVRIVDYKTGKAPPPAYADEALFQLNFYALMFYRLRGVVPARLRLIYLGNGRLIESAPDVRGLEAFERRLAELWRTIQQATTSGDFPPRRSKLCDWCAFQHACPEFGGIPPPYPGTAETAGNQ